MGPHRDAVIEINDVLIEDAAANETGDSKKFDALFQKMYELGKKLGPEYAALVDGLQDIDPQSEVGREISSTLDVLDNFCGGSSHVDSLSADLPYSIIDIFV